MSEGEKEIMVHIMAIESFLVSTYRIKTEKWNQALEEIRKRYGVEEEQKNEKM